MKNQFKNTFVALISIIVLASCDKDDPTAVNDPNGLGTIKIKFDNIIGTGASEPDDLVLGGSFTTASGEQITVNEINYIISNLVLIKEDGTEVMYSKDSLFIINERLAKNELYLSNIPTGKYKKLRFGFGVDKEYWETGETAQQNFWDKAKLSGMTWSWTSGYKFMKLEGTAKVTPESEAVDYKIHLGGYAPNNNYREVTVDFTDPAEVGTSGISSVHLFVDIKQVFDGTEKIKLSEGATIMGGDRLIPVANNSSKMFSVDHVHQANAH